MAVDADRQGRVTTRMRWVARIWSIPLIAFALLMFGGYTWSWITTGVADPYAVDDYPPTEALPPILLFVSILGLAIAWRWVQWGGTIALVFQLAALAALAIHRPITRDFSRSAAPYGFVMITIPPGLLFLVYWWRTRKGRKTEA